MEYNKLSPTEIEAFKSIMQRYGKYHEDVVLMEDTIDTLTEEKDRLLDQINKMVEKNREIIRNIEAVRQEEKELKAKLAIKYGTFSLNLETFEINKHNK